MNGRLIECAALSAAYARRLGSRLSYEQVLVESERGLVFLVPVVLVEARVGIAVYHKIRPGAERAIQRDSEESQVTDATNLVFVRALDSVAGQRERSQGGFIETRDVDRWQGGCGSLGVRMTQPLHAFLLPKVQQIIGVECLNLILILFSLIW